MYVRTIEIPYVNRRWNTTHIKHVDDFKCDECEQTFQKSHKASHANNALTFCSRVCNKKSRSIGKLAAQWKSTKLERYGVEYSSQVLGATEKMMSSRLASTGANCPSDVNSSSNEKFRNTMLEKHGAEHPSNILSVKAKKKATFIERYGVDNPLCAGSKFRSHSGCVKGGQLGYRSLVRKLGDKALSKPEALMATFLRERFGDNQVEQQVLLQHGGDKPWLIDFYVKNLDVYVEVDGVFWHGLTSTYENLHPKQRGQYDRDRAKDAWFLSVNKRLVRVTDVELLACQDSGNWSDIVAKLGG